MNKMRYTKYLLIMLTMLIVTSCAPSLPDGVLSPDEMEDVLLDMHVAQGLYDTHEFRSTDSDIIALRANVLKKHDITQEEWEHSITYYCQHADELHNIYVNLVDRVERSVISLGGKSEGMQGEEADTANVWNSSNNVILMQQPPYNILSYDITPDSTFQDGDNISLQCDVKFIFQDGYKALALIMAVSFDNDSVATSISHLNRDGHGIVTINNEKDRLHIKNIKGFIMLERNLESVSTKQASTTLRLISLRNIKLLHLHTTPPPPPEVPTDSVKTDSVQAPPEQAQPAPPQQPGIIK